MSRYGLNYYGLSTYGPDTTVSYSVTSFVATSIDYGSILLTWTSPPGAWSKIKIVRNSYGFPVNENDGVQLDLKGDGLFTAFKETDLTNFLDSGLAEGKFYYYSMFIYELTSFRWLRVGTVIGLSVQDYGYGDKLYDYLPDIYKITSLNEVSGSYGNDVLQRFLNVFGFQLNRYYTITQLLVNRYDMNTISGDLLPVVLQEFGHSYEQEIGLQQSRILARSATDLFKEKGSELGLREFLKAYIGYAVPSAASTAPLPYVNGVTVGHNLMLDYNDSSFEESQGHWTGDGTANLYNNNQEYISSISVTSNVATITTVGNHTYAVRNKFYVSYTILPILNTFTSIAPATITAVTSNTISFALTTANLGTTSLWNTANNSYPIILPYPLPWVESTAPSLYPNKQKGILAVRNQSASPQTIKIYCGSTDPVRKGIPVTSGLAYTFSVYTVASTTSRIVTLGIDWYDRFGVYLSSSTGSGTASGTGAFSARPVVTGTAPSNAYYAVPTASIASAAGSASNESQYFDCAQFEQASSVTSFDEARQLHITLKATRINELINPHFASPYTPWTSTSSTLSTDTSSIEPGTIVWGVAYKSLTSNVARIETTYTHDYKVGSVVVVSGVDATFNGVYTVTNVGVSVSGVNNAFFEYSLTHSNVVRVASTGSVWKSGNAMKVTATATTTVNTRSWDGSTNSQQMPIYYPDTYYTFSVYAALDKTAGTGNETVVPYILWYDSSHTLLSTTTGSSFTISHFDTAWDRPYVSGIAPHTAAYAVVGINWAATSGHILRYDSALFENAYSVSYYFDGDSGNGTISDYLWEGSIPNGARSHYYKNNAVVQSRITGPEFLDNIVLGTTVAIYLGQPAT